LRGEKCWVQNPDPKVVPDGHSPRSLFAIWNIKLKECALCHQASSILPICLVLLILLLFQDTFFNSMRVLCLLFFFLCFSVCITIGWIISQAPGLIWERLIDNLHVHVSNLTSTGSYVGSM
jgi:hypothetical protein